MRDIRSARIPRSPNKRAGMQVRLLLPYRGYAIYADNASQVSGGLLLRFCDMPPRSVPLRIQVPCGIVLADCQPAAILYSEQPGHQPDLMPYWVQVRQASPLQRDAVPQRDVRDLRGEEVVRPVPRRAVLSDSDEVGAVPGGVVLPGRFIEADGMPCQSLLPARIVKEHRVPGWEDFNCRGQVQESMHVNVIPTAGTVPAV